MITLELHLDEAQFIYQLLTDSNTDPALFSEIVEQLAKLIDHEIEIQSLDLNECEGGACKL